MGFVAAMIASLKANKRSPISAFNKIKDFKKSKKSELYFKRKATPYELKKIGDKIKKENETAFWRKVTILIILITVLLIGLNFIE